MKKIINIFKQLNNKTFPVVMITSGVFALLLVLYFVISFTSKGTFTLEDEVKYYCANGKESQAPSNLNGINGCCLNDALPNWIYENENICVSDYFDHDYVTSANDGYCEVGLNVEFNGQNVCNNAIGASIHGDVMVME